MGIVRKLEILSEVEDVKGRNAPAALEIVRHSSVTGKSKAAR